MGNTVLGNYAQTAAVMMANYDRLPPALRELYRNCLFDYAVKRSDVKLDQSASYVLDWLNQSDMSLARRYAKKLFGKQARAYLDAQPPRRKRDYFDKPSKRRPS